jgi:thioredoxin-related protein
MKSIPVLLLFTMFAITSCNGQANHVNQKIKWLTFEQAIAANEKAPKKIFIDIYTDWCGWCKKMDASTFMDDEVANYMNTHFYAVKYNAESRDTVVYKGHNFVYVPERKANALALSLLNEKMSYPTFVVMDEQVSLLSPIPGYQTPAQLMPILKYFGSNIYKQQNYTVYSDSLKQLVK